MHSGSADIKEVKLQIAASPLSDFFLEQHILDCCLYVIVVLTFVVYFIHSFDITYERRVIMVVSC
jgi:hypothetical protein